MRLFVATISAFALSTAATAAAHAQTAAHVHSRAQAPVASTALADERCLLEMVALTNSGNDQNVKGFGQAGIIYFTGRLAHDPNFDFGRLKALIGTLDVKEVQSDLQQHCAPAFEKSMQQMQSAIAPPKAASQPPVGTPPAATPPAAPAAPPAAPPVMELPH
jgi:hypothetical protein